MQRTQHAANGQRTPDGPAPAVMRRARRALALRLAIVLVLVAGGVIALRVGLRTESTLALTWFGVGMFAWVAAAIPAGPLTWRPRGGWSVRAVVAPVLVGVAVGLVLVFGAWILAAIGLQDAVELWFAPLNRLPLGWVALAAIAVPVAEELALRHGMFALVPPRARILGTMAVSVAAWWLIGNEVGALAAICPALAAARQRWVTGSLLGPVVTRAVAAGLVLVLGPLVL